MLIIVFLQDKFLEYYSTVMPYINFVMTKARGESNGLLLSATISCMTAIWMVIGKDNFSDDTQQVITSSVNARCGFRIG